MAALEKPILLDRSGESQALMGLACYQSEDYGEAARHYEAAIKLKSDNDDWRDMLRKSTANATAGIDVPVPTETYFNSDDLAATIPSGVFPALIKPNFGDSSIGITQDAVVYTWEEASAYLNRLRQQLPQLARQVGLGRREADQRVATLSGVEKAELAGALCRPHRGRPGARRVDDHRVVAKRNLLAVGGRPGADKRVHLGRRARGGKGEQKHGTASHRR